MIGAGELRKGSAIELDGKTYQIIDFHHIKMGRGSAQVRLKLRDIRNGNTLERSFQANEKFKPVFLEHRPVQYLYSEGELYYFMDNETYEQMILTAEQCGEAIKYFNEQFMLEILTCGGEPITVKLPAAVSLKVIQADPGLKGDTATGGSKAVTLETGLVVQVPLFIEAGNVIKISTRTGEYLEKAG